MSAAISLFVIPDAAASTIRERSRSRTEALRDDDHRSSCFLSDSGTSILAATRIPSLSRKPVETHLDTAIQLKQWYKSDTTLGAAQPAATLAGYASLYLDQEVRAEGLTRNIGNFARFLEAASFSHGGQLNVAAIARECGVPRKAVASYIDILQDLLLAYTLPVFRRRAKRQTSAHSKFYLFDAGVFRALRPRGPLDRPSEIDGQALEGLVAQHLRAWAAYSSEGTTLHFWRTRSGVEVDFVAYGPRGLQACEVKNASRVEAKDLRGLRAFREDYPEAEAALLYRGQDRLRMNDIWCLPVDDFLRRIVPKRGLLDWLVN